MEREAVVIEAIPCDTATGPPMGVPPSENWTVPETTPPPGATTLMVAVKVTGCPTEEGLGEDVKVVLVEALFTVCANVGELLPRNFAV